MNAVGCCPSVSDDSPPVVGDVPLFRCSAPAVPVATTTNQNTAAATVSVAEQRVRALKWTKEQFPDQPWIWDANLSKSRAAYLKSSYKRKKLDEEERSKILSAEEQHLRAKAWADKTLPTMMSENI
jgi:hypothetical protein